MIITKDTNKLAYVAGILDSDGCVTMSYFNGGRCYIRRYGMVITTDDKFIVPTVGGILGIPEKVKIVKLKGHKNNSHRLDIRDKKSLVKILNSIHQYSYTKQPRIEYMLSCMNIKNDFTNYTDSEGKNWWGNYTKFRKLTKVGLEAIKDNITREHTFSWSWLAGIIDGDGELSIIRQKNKNNIIHRPVVQLNMTHELTISYIADNLGVNYSEVNAHGNRRNFYRIRMMSGKILEVLPYLIPHLIFKKELAILLVDICQLRKDTPNGQSEHPNVGVVKKKIDEFRKINENKYGGF